MVDLEMFFFDVIFVILYKLVGDCVWYDVDYIYWDGDLVCDYYCLVWCVMVVNIGECIFILVIILFGIVYFNGVFCVGGVDNWIFIVCVGFVLSFFFDFFVCVVFKSGIY